MGSGGASLEPPGGTFGGPFWRHEIPLYIKRVFIGVVSKSFIFYISLHGWDFLPLKLPPECITQNSATLTRFSVTMTCLRPGSGQAGTLDPTPTIDIYNMHQHRTAEELAKLMNMVNAPKHNPNVATFDRRTYAPKHTQDGPNESCA